MTTLPPAFQLSILTLCQNSKPFNSFNHAWILASMKSYDGIIQSLGCRLSMFQLDTLQDHLDTIIEDLTKSIEKDKSNPHYLNKIIELAGEITDQRIQRTTALEIELGKNLSN